MYLSVKVRLALLLFIPIVFFVATAYYLLSLNSSNIKRMNQSLYEVSYIANNHIVSADRDFYQAMNAYNLLRFVPLPSEAYAEYEKDFNENVAQVSERIDAAQAILQDAKLMDNVEETSALSAEAAFSQYETAFKEWSEIATGNVKDRSPVDQAGETALSERFENSRTAIDTLSSLLDQYSKQETDAIIKKKNADTRSMYTVLFIEWIVIILAAFFTLRHLNRTIANLQNKTRMVAGGNLHFERMAKYSKDEFGRLNESMDTMIEKIRGLVLQISDNTQTVSAAAVELSVSAKEAAATTNHVAENIQEVTSQVEVQATIAEETSRAVEEMSSGIQKIAENTNSISDLSATASGQVDEGNEHMLGLKEQLNEIMQAIQALSAIVANLNEKSDKIGEITENITSFANQTNILSLNASIEAARAGEHGKGFAVVAQEIRNLAAGSLESAEVISALISETRDEIGKASTFMESTVSQAEKGSRLMDDVAEDFDSIHQAVKKVVEQVHETSAITEQMSASSEEVAASMEQSSNSSREVAGKAQTVAAATEEQLALGESISHAADQLQTIVQSLKASVSQFKL
ncbi:methyl-accepting chemotaxis protein [Cohnella thailandensis]|uniref:Methyl-accepting chemotaxis protein n=1 Tax=Cohnella thailandensis TaxID=557557 RepID=A0A841SV13_9BACL|nr:HAMP domain-containing methyl-accepting chemotaxis protein [Cohnella thailandensis]MBB6633467.1 methyl-accepting chemotaxis protein [Cohnella thailandensis]MBP1974484.1 methyl-accepting chemotaxis protein [Cohnella thailandensis]